MIQLSTKAFDYLNNRKSRKIDVKILINGNEINGKIRKLKIDKGSCGDLNFHPASIFSNTVEATIDTADNSFTINNGDKVEVYMSLPLCDDNAWYKVSTTYSRNSSVKKNRIELRSCGVISYKLGRTYTGSIPETVGELLSIISNDNNVSIQQVVLNLDTPINNSSYLNKPLYRELLTYIAGLVFGFVTEDKDGNIVIKKFTNTYNTGITVSADKTKEDASIYEENTVSGIYISSNDGEKQIEYIYPKKSNVFNCDLSNPLMTADLFNSNVSSFYNYKYYPFDLEMTLGNFAIEANDTITIKTRDDKTITGRCMNITHSYDGGLTTTISCPSLEYEEAKARDTVSLYTQESHTEIVDNKRHPFPKDYKNIFVSDSAFLRVKNNGLVQFRGLYYDINTIPAEYMPAFPVSVNFGTSAGAYSNSKNRIIVQATFFNELTEDGLYVKTKLIKKWFNLSDNKGDAEAYNPGNYRITANWILASRWNEYRPKSEIEAEEEENNGKC